MGETAFTIKKEKNSNKTIRMPDVLIERLQRVADENDVSFNRVVVQCCEYALERMQNETDG